MIQLFVKLLIFRGVTKNASGPGSVILITPYYLELYGQFLKMLLK